MARHDVSVVIRAHDRASKTFRRVGAAGMALKSAIASLAGAAGVYFGGRAVIDMIKYGASYEKTMSRVKVLTDATAGEFERLDQTAKDLGRSTEFSARQAAEAMSNLALAGFKTTEIIDSLPSVLNLASAGQMEMAEAASIAGTVLRGMQIPARDLGRVVDVLAAGMSNANTTLGELGRGMAKVGSIGTLASVDLTELVVGLQFLYDAGKEAEEGGTALRRIIAMLAADTGPTAETLKELGVEIKDATGGMRPLADILEDWNKATAHLGPVEKLAKVIDALGQKAGPAMTDLLGRGGEAFRNYQRTVEDSLGRAQRIAEEQLNNVAGSWVKLKSVIGGIVLDITSQTDGWFKNWLDSFREGVSVTWEILKGLDLAWEWFWSGFKADSIAFYEDLKWLFGRAIPEVLGWFTENLRQVVNAIGTVFRNLAVNIWNNIKEILSKGPGYQNWELTWTPLLEGFEAAFAKLPEIAAREMTQVEKDLYARAKEAGRQFWENVANAGKPSLPPGVPAGPGSPPTGKPSGDGLPEEPLATGVTRQGGKPGTIGWESWRTRRGGLASPEADAAKRTAQNTRETNRLLRQLRYNLTFRPAAAAQTRAQIVEAL